MTEQTLSNKMGYDYEGEFITCSNDAMADYFKIEDVREAVKKLKDKLNKDLNNGRDIMLSEQAINEIFGERLI